MFRRQTSGSVVCRSCGSLVGVRDEQCFSCGARFPGLWGYAPLVRSLGHDLGFVPLIISFIQQLREGMNDFFVTFIRVLQDRKGKSLEVEPAVTAGDFLDGFYQGTRRALYENGRESITITIDQLSAFSVGVLIALFERTVGLYARLININAYHQPGVEAGKESCGDGDCASEPHC